MKIGIYKDTGVHGGTLGGTEYCVALLAETLSQGHEVDLIHHRPSFDKDAFLKMFGTDLSAVHVRQVPYNPEIFGQSRLPWRRYQQSRAWHAEVSQGYDYFLAFIHQVPPFCHAPDGMFVILFPFFDRLHVWPWQTDDTPRAPTRKERLRRRYLEWEWKKRIHSYPVKAAICDFTGHWTRLRYGVLCENFYPPANSNFDVVDKTNTILSVGRFTANKNQLEMVGAFRQMEDLRAEGWEFQCVGGIEKGTADGQLYFDAACSVAANHGITVIGDVERLHLKALYEHAKIFWHACGYTYDEKRYPELMEHFGIVTAEAMAAGCVPVVINKGGQPEIVQHGVSGFVWNTLDELKGYTTLLARNEDLRQRMSEAARERAQIFSKECFLDRFFTLAPQLT